MIELIKAIILGAVQGITEFLPVSSTGHLILFEKLLNISHETYGLTFDAALHLGTLFAVLWFFKNDWLGLIKVIPNVVRNLAKRRVFPELDPSAAPQSDGLFLLLLIGTIPAVIFGLLLEDLVDTVFRSPLLVAVSLILFSFVLIYVEIASRKNKNITHLKFLDGLFIGTAQAIALIPGVSRSGITMAAGLKQGLTREQAARFAFLLSAPIIAGAGGKKLLDIIELATSGQLTFNQLLFFLAGMLSAAFFGYLTIKYFLKFISQHTLWPFIVYRMVLGISIIGLHILTN